MIALQHPDIHHLQAAIGWLELGNHVEADVELNKITLKLRAHPDVLEARWQICAAAKKWDAALDIASSLIQLVPDRPFGWIHRSFCLHELKRTAEARDSLLPVVEKFPGEAIMRYNLACYCCQMGNVADAWAWLEKAFKVGDQKRLKLMAFDDPDLEPMWNEIRNYYR